MSLVMCHTKISETEENLRKGFAQNRANRENVLLW